MKTFFTILGICIVGILAEAADEKKAELLIRAEELACVKESGIDLVGLGNVLKEKIDKNDKKLACFVACMSKKFGLMNSDGSINESKLRVRESDKKERADVVINKCKVMKGANDCETARKVINCIIEEDSLL